MSFSFTAPPRRVASSTASSLCLSVMPNLRMMISVSTPGSSMSPRTSSTRPERAARRRREPRDLGDDHVARLGVLPVLVRDHHVHDQPPIERDEVPCAGVVDFEAADNRLRPALEDADDASFGAVLAPLLDARDDAVAVHRLVQVGARR